MIPRFCNTVAVYTAPSRDMPVLLHIIASWRTRLAECLHSLRAHDDARADFLLRMQVRILTFLLTRYDDDSPMHAQPQVGQPQTAQAQPGPLNAGLFMWRFETKVPEPSEAFPPRPVDQLRSPLHAIHNAVEASRRK